MPPERRTFTAPPSTFNRCPRGHDLPNTEGELECSSERCALDLALKDTTSKQQRSEEQRVELETRRLLSREVLRKNLIPTPEGLEGAAAESYVEQKLTNLSVVAVAELEWQLRFGSDAERMKAADKILDATGHGKKDRVGSNTQLIIVNGFSGVLPWAKAQEAKVVEAPKALPPAAS